MTPTSQVTNIPVFLEKIISYKGGALIIISAPISEGYLEIISVLTGDVELKTFAMPFIVATLSLMMYGVFYVIDFITGIKASRYEANDKRNYLKSDKFWSSMWKLGVISVLVMGLTVFALVFALIELTYLYNILIFGIVIICIMASLFDLHSIGENHKRRFKTKPKIFTWLDKITTLVDEQIMQGIKNVFKKISG